MQLLAARQVARRAASESGAPNAGSQVASEYSKLASAKPQDLLAEFQSLRSKLTAAMGASDRIPGIAKGLSRAIPAINSIIQELEKAASAVKIISPPINNSIAPTMQGPGGVPGAPNQAQTPFAA